MKKALILGTNAGQADIINYLKNTGWYVHSCGHERKGPGIYISDQFHLVDILDVQKVKLLAENLQVDIVYSVSSDIAIRTATKVSETLGLPTLVNSDLIELFHYKQKLRAYLNKINLSTVKFIEVNSIDQINAWDIFPCIVKPVDSHGQRGLALIHSADELGKATQAALSFSESSSVIIEEYLEGVEISSNVVVQNGKVLVNEFTERLVHPLPLIGLPYGHAIPLRKVSDENHDKAVRLVENLVEQLNIENAVLYIQFKVTKEGPKIIEVAPRLDGCHIWRLLKLARGYDLRSYAIKCLTGTEISQYNYPEDNSKFTLEFFQMKTGSAFSKKQLSIPDDMLYHEFRYEENEIIQSVNGTLEVVGYYVKKE